MQEIKLWKFIYERLKLNLPVMFLSVLESKGSSPGRQGFKMAVADDDMIGSIGGGIMEHKFVELAKEKLKDVMEVSILKKQFHDKDAGKNQSGMICSGEQTIYLHQVKQIERVSIEKIISSLELNRNGELRITADGISFSENKIPEKAFHFEMKSETDFECKEKTGYKNHLYIIGGGHCALALSKIMSGMDFYIHLYDERENLNTVRENRYVNAITVIQNFDSLREQIPSGKNHFAIIMTFGYRSDLIALRALINKDFKYLGMLGSKTKVDKVLSELRQDGISESKLQSIHAPIGMNIKSETPEEIAVSIAAEIIKIKNSPLTPERGTI